jgi:hypothetical protein
MMDVSHDDCSGAASRGEKNHGLTFVGLDTLLIR